MMHYELKIGKSVIWNKCSSDLPERQKSMYIKKMSSLELPFEQFPFEKNHNTLILAFWGKQYKL